MSWSCSRCGGEHPDSLVTCHSSKSTGILSGSTANPYNGRRNERQCQHCGGEIPLTYDYCPCQSHWEGFADR